MQTMTSYSADAWLLLSRPCPFEPMLCLSQPLAISLAHVRRSFEVSANSPYDPLSVHE